MRFTRPARCAILDACAVESPAGDTAGLHAASVWVTNGNYGVSALIEVRENCRVRSVNGPSADLDGRPRISQRYVDTGAYENHSAQRGTVITLK